MSESPDRKALRAASAWVAQYHGMQGHDAASRSMSRVIDAALAQPDPCAALADALQIAEVSLKAAVTDLEAFRSLLAKMVAAQSLPFDHAERRSALANACAALAAYEWSKS